MPFIILAQDAVYYLSSRCCLLSQLKMLFIILAQDAVYYLDQDILTYVNIVQDIFTPKCRNSKRSLSKFPLFNFNKNALLVIKPRGSLT